MYDTVLKDQCLVAGEGVMAIYGFNVGNQGKWVGIMLGIIAVMRLMEWAVMVWKK
jgi:hypothetical protein